MQRKQTVLQHKEASNSSSSDGNIELMRKYQTRDYSLQIARSAALPKQEKRNIDKLRLGIVSNGALFEGKVQ